MSDHPPEPDPVPMAEPPPVGNPPAEPTLAAPTGLVMTPPKDLGLMLVSAGVVGMVLPGPGVPALVAGGLILWPEAFCKVDRWLQRRFPDTRRKGIGHINRFLADLERRYPGSTKSGDGESGPERP